VINPSLVYRAPLVPTAPCCARTTDRHLVGCRHWSPRPDWDRFYVEIEHRDGVTVGAFALGARGLGKLLLRLARCATPWCYSVLMLEGNYFDVDHAYVVGRRRL